MRVLENPSEIFFSELQMKRTRSIALLSTCKRSKCGSVITTGHNDNDVIGVGCNSMPCDLNSVCFKDNISEGFKSDKSCCVHAEQRAILEAVKDYPEKIKGSTLYFVRLDEQGNIKKSGAPYCTICSKMALDVGILLFVLWHEKGITIYNTKEYNEISFMYPNYQL